MSTAMQPRCCSELETLTIVLHGDVDADSDTDVDACTEIDMDIYINID